MFIYDLCNYFTGTASTKVSVLFICISAYLMLFTCLVPCDFRLFIIVLMVNVNVSISNYKIVSYF